MPPGGNPGKEIMERRRNRKRRGASPGVKDRQADRQDSSQIKDNSGGSGRNGSTTSAPDIVNEDRMTPQSALGQSFDRAVWDDMQANPDVVATKWMQMQGIDPMAGGGMAKTFNDLASVIPQLYYLTQGMGGVDQTTPAGFFDYADKFLNDATTSSQINPNVLLNMFNAGSGSSLGAMLNDPSMDMSQQLQTAMGMLGAGLSQSVGAPVGSALMGQAEQLARQWMAENGDNTTNPTTFIDYLKSKGYDQYF